METAQPKLTFGPDFASFINYLLAGETSTVFSPERYAELLAVDITTLAESASVHRNTVLRAPDSARLQHLLHESVRVLHAAAELNGSVESALSWYVRMPLPPFGYKTASILVAENRTEALLSYLASLDAGYSG